MKYAKQFCKFFWLFFYILSSGAIAINTLQGEPVGLLVFYCSVWGGAYGALRSWIEQRDRE